MGTQILQETTSEVFLKTRKIIPSTPPLSTGLVPLPQKIGQMLYSW